MYKKTLVVLVVALLLSSLLPLTALAADPPDGKWQIRMLLGAVDNPHWNRVARGGEAAAEQLGNVELTVLYAEDDSNPEEQIAQIEDSVAAGVNALIVDCHGFEAMVPVIERVTKEGTPVFIVDRHPNTDVVISKVQTDNELAGYMGAKWVAEQIGGKGKMLVIDGAPGGESYINRKAGAERALAEYPDIERISLPADWQTPKAQSVTEDVLTANPDLAGIFAANDMMALGAAAALASRDLSDTVPLCGLDGAVPALEMVSDGRMGATVAQFPGRMGFLSTLFAVRYLQGEEVPKLVDSGEFVVTYDNAPAFLAGFYGD